LFWADKCGAYKWLVFENEKDPGANPGAFAQKVLALAALEGFDQLRQDLVDITNDAKVSDGEDRRL
jgi:hypothetical protein